MKNEVAIKVTLIQFELNFSLFQIDYHSQRPVWNHFNFKLFKVPIILNYSLCIIVFIQGLLTLMGSVMTANPFIFHLRKNTMNSKVFEITCYIFNLNLCKPSNWMILILTWLKPLGNVSPECQYPIKSMQISPYFLYDL